MGCGDWIDCKWGGDVGDGVMGCPFGDGSLPRLLDYFVGESGVTTTTPSSVTGKR